VWIAVDRYRLIICPLKRRWSASVAGLMIITSIFISLIISIPVSLMLLFICLLFIYLFIYLYIHSFYFRYSLFIIYHFGKINKNK